MTAEMATVLLRMKRARRKALEQWLTTSTISDEAYKEATLLDAEIKELKKIIKER